MSETSLELPQFSLARYFDLLRRRRWQVIPVSLIGLLVGGIVAFFVPRYYVAETRLEYYRMPTEVDASLLEDPFKFVVENATILLPQAAAATIQKLGWPESREADPSRRQELLREIEQRIGVYDVNPAQKRAYAQIVVSYRDREGQRAAEFLEQLVATWMEQRLVEMRGDAELRNTQANKHMRAARDEYNQINSDLSQLAAQHGFNRLLDPGAQHQELRLRSEALQRRTERLDLARGEVAALDQRIATLERQINTTRRSIDTSTLSIGERFKPGSDEAKLFAELQVMQREVDEVMGVAYPNRGVYEARLAELKQKLEAALTSGGEIVNPELEKRRAELDAAREKRAAALKIRDDLEAEVVAETERAQRRASAEQEFLAKNNALQEAQKRREAASDDLQAAIRMLEQLDSAPPIKQIGVVLVPKRPTEPNIMLVAVLGCVAGLGIAIGLILLLDMLQGTLKTVDDVERSLPVPMLGGVSHLETEEERTRAVSGRRRASLVAGVLLLGAVVVVTTYYVAPHRLPPFARDLLSIVLGG